MKKTIIPVLLALLLCGCAAKEPPETTMQTVPTETMTPAVTTVPMVPSGQAVETPCGTLWLPDDWDEPILIQTTLGEPMVITFLAGETPLYSLTFSETARDEIGMVRVDGETVYVGMEIHTLEEPTDMLLSMQESVNVLLEQLALEPVEQMAEDIVVETAYGVLHFPLKWEELLYTEQPADECVEFYAALPGREPVLLFTVTFGTREGDLSAVLTGADGTRTDFAVVIRELSLDESWTGSEKDAAYAMQEDLNYLLDALAE